jgi:hypothetical protein
VKTNYWKLGILGVLVEQIWVVSLLQKFRLLLIMIQIHSIPAAMLSFSRNKYYLK